MLNHIDIMGRLCNDPELRHTPSGVPVCTFRIANDTGRKDRDGNRITRFVTCVAWRGSAEFAAKYENRISSVVLSSLPGPFRVLIPIPDHTFDHLGHDPVELRGVFCSNYWRTGLGVNLGSGITGNSSSSSGYFKILLEGRRPPFF